MIAHEGDTNYFHSNLELVLDQGVGVFISVNSLGKDGAAGAIRNAVFNEFMDRYYPAPPTGPEPTLASAKTDGALIAGTYQSSRRIQTKVLDFVYVVGQVKIVEAPDGTLTVGGIDQLGGAPKHWREIAPFVWRDTDGHDRMAAKVENGVVKAVWFDETVPAFVLQPVPASHDGSWMLPLLGAATGLLLLLVLAWPVAALVRRRYRGTFTLSGSRALAFRWVRVLAAVDVVFVAGMVGIILNTATRTDSLDGSSDWIFRVFQAFGLVGLLGVIVGPWNLVEVWRDRASSWWAKLVAILVAAAFLAIAVLALLLHFLTPTLNY